MDNLVNNNPQEIYFTSLRGKYASLSSVYIENNILVFPNGVIPLDKISLERVPEKVFLMKPESIYIYLSQKLYETLDASVLTDLNIQMEKEARLAKIYVAKFRALVSLFNNEESLRNDPEFYTDLAQRKQAIEEARKSNILRSILDESEESRVMQNDNNEMSTNMSNDNSQSLGGPAKVLKLTNPNAPAISPISQEIMAEREKNNGGFSSILLMLIVTLGFGVYLALVLIK